MTARDRLTGFILTLMAGAALALVGAWHLPPIDCLPGAILAALAFWHLEPWSGRVR